MSDALTVVEFRERFPEFNDPVVSDAKVQAMIDDTQCNFNITRWGCSYKRAHSLYVAHFLILDSRRSFGGSSGASPALQATSKSADGVSIGYNTLTSASNSEELLKSTNYGQEYLMLLNNSKRVGAQLING